MLVIGGPGSGQEASIAVKQFAIGRGSGNHLRLEGALISRHHALIALENNQFVLYDRDSTNGTYANGRRIAQHVLKSGDQIQIGPSLLLFQAPGVATPTTPPLPHRVATPSPPRELAGDFGEYQLTEKIASGGAATVYKGVFRRDHRTVAIKILHEKDPYIRDKFEQEGEIGKRLFHPHIARILDYGQTGGTFYIVMEYVDQGSLRDRLRSGQPLANNLVITIVGQTAEALDYAHGQGVIHRDIKPENIMFSSQDGVKIVDFGIAKVTSSITRTTDGLIVGTPYYLSFEQAKGLPVDHTSDIYSLGVVLYEMATGRVPFMADDMLEVVHKHITEIPVPPSTINPSVPRRLEEVTLRALSKKPGQRFHTTGDMARALGYDMPAPSEMPRITAGPAESESLTRVAQLIIVGGQATGKTMTVSPGMVILRRRDINPRDMLISREHARIFRQGRQLWLEDLGSTNGTFHNGRRIFDRVLLRNGDEIRVGDAVLRIQT